MKRGREKNLIMRLRLPSARGKYVIYIDLESAFNSVGHETLWQWLLELNIPTSNLLWALYEQAS